MATDGHGDEVRLESLEWGDVLADTGDVVLCSARLDEDAVLAKRWRGQVLDAELAARRLLGAAGVSCAALLGGGAGWLVLEDLAETMWRPATPHDLADAATVRALARWYVAVHQLEPAGLEGAVAWQLLGPELVGLAADALAAGPGGALSHPLPAAVEHWRAVLAERPARLVVGAFEARDVAVVGAGMDAMATDLSLAHAGAPETDVRLVHQVLDDAAWRAFVQEYASVSPQGQLVPERVDAEQGLARAAAVVLPVLGGAVPGEAAVSHLQESLDRVP